MGKNCMSLLLESLKIKKVSTSKIEGKPTNKKIKSVAFIAHDNMKAALSRLVNEFQDILINFRLLGTETTLEIVTKQMNRYENNEIKLGESCRTGPLGGDAEISSELIHGKVGCIIFLIDPLSVHPHQADIDSLLRLARVHNILLATNEITARCVIERLQYSIETNSELPKSMTEIDVSSAVDAFLRRDSCKFVDDLKKSLK
eukprot:235097_1